MVARAENHMTRRIQLVPARVNVTDRALRYRANQEGVRPEDPRICGFCGSRRNVEVEHVDGHEENCEPHNLMWACRSCNTTKGAFFARAGAGRRTHQYNPAGGARNLGQWMNAVLSAKGDINTMEVRDAVAMIHATPASRRSEFAREIWSRRRQRGEADAVPF